MKKQLFTLAMILMAATTGVVAQTKWALDKVHSNVKFTVSHMVVSEVEGSFKMFDGSLVASKADLSDAVINFTVDVASVNTDNAMRDDHLKGDDFFNVEKFPKMTFVSKSMQPLGGNKYKLIGDLTIRDVTKTVTFDVTYGGQINTGKGVKAGFKAKTTIDRLAFGQKFNPAIEAGPVVGKDVEVTILAELDKK
ncbi:MAG: YceI family protein [bacterium]|jgi:polyisoprenoid-binding protein YceI